jgi:hypothetical protein
MATRRPKLRTFPAGTSEFTGLTRANTLPAKEAGAPLDGWERLRLIYVTGTEDIEAEPDRRAWLGLESEPDSIVDFED